MRCSTYCCWALTPVRAQTTGRTDTMIILTVDTNNQKIKLMSLMRDIIVAIPGRENNRLNAAFVFGGADLLLQTIEENFGIHIEHYVGVNFSMLASLIDQLGGLTLTVESEYYMDRINAVIKEDNKVLGVDVNDGLLTHAGEQLMTGKQAQAYARYRYGNLRRRLLAAPPASARSSPRSSTS